MSSGFSVKGSPHPTSKRKPPPDEQDRSDTYKRRKLSRQIEQTHPVSTNQELESLSHEVQLLVQELDQGISLTDDQNDRLASIKPFYEARKKENENHTLSAQTYRNVACTIWLKRLKPTDIKEETFSLARKQLKDKGIITDEENHAWRDLPHELQLLEQELDQGISLTDDQNARLAFIKQFYQGRKKENVSPTFSAQTYRNVACTIWLKRPRPTDIKESTFSKVLNQLKDKGIITDEEYQEWSDLPHELQLLEQELDQGTSLTDDQTKRRDSIKQFYETRKKEKETHTCAMETYRNVAETVWLKRQRPTDIKENTFSLALKQLKDKGIITDEEKHAWRNSVELH